MGDISEKDTERDHGPHNGEATTPEMAREQARQLLQAERQERVAACHQAIQQVLQTYNCRLVPHLEIVAGAVQHSVEIVANGE